MYGGKLIRECCEIVIFFFLVTLRPYLYKDPYRILIVKNIYIRMTRKNVGFQKLYVLIFKEVNRNLEALIFMYTSQ